VQLEAPGDDIGGNDGTDWAGPSRRSIFTFFLDPTVAVAVDALHAGDPRGISLLERLGCDAVDARAWVRSLGYGAQADATDRALARAGLASSPGDESRIAALHGYPLLSLARTIETLPGDLRSMVRDPNRTYLDSPGYDPADAVRSAAYRPDPQLGWVTRRDIDDATAGGPGGPSYGIVSAMPGSRVALDSVPGTRMLVWSERNGGLSLGGKTISARVPTWISTGEAFDAVVRSGSAAVYETGERPVAIAPQLASTLAAARLIDARTIAPWHYALRADLSGAAVVVLRERFDPKWELAGEGIDAVRHVRADGFANAWIVRGHGLRTIDITYADQRPTSVLLALSGIAFAALVLTTLAFEIRSLGARSRARAYPR
jgi:hypothetical protein